MYKVISKKAELRLRYFSRYEVRDTRCEICFVRLRAPFPFGEGWGEAVTILVSRTSIVRLKIFPKILLFILKSVILQHEIMLKSVVFELSSNSK